MKPTIEQLENRAKHALAIINQCGGIDGAHHKQWVLDRVVNALHGGEEDEDCEGYKMWIEAYEDDGKYEWDRGIAP